MQNIYYVYNVKYILFSERHMTVCHYNDTQPTVTR